MDYDNLKSELCFYKSEVISLGTDIITRDEEITELKSESNKLKTDLESERAIIVSLRLELASRPMTETFNKLRDDIIELNRRNAELETENRMMEQMLVSTKTKYKNLKEAVRPNAKNK